jgi:hypothetical protein
MRHTFKMIVLTVATTYPLLLSSCSTQTTTKEPVGDTRAHYDWLIRECEVNESLIAESNYTKSASQLGRRSYCSEAEELRERVTGIEDSNAPGAKDF